MNDEAATDQGTYKQQLQCSIWFLRVSIVFCLKILHRYCNMLEELI